MEKNTVNLGIHITAKMLKYVFVCVCFLPYSSFTFMFTQFLVAFSIAILSSS